MTTTTQKTKIILNPEKTRKAIIMATGFAGTKEETLKEIFKDILMEIPPDSEYGIISSSNSRELFQIIIPVEKRTNTDEHFAIRIDSNKIKGILKNFNEKITIESNENYMKFSSDKSSIKIQKTPTNILKEQFEIIKMEKERVKVTTIEAEKFLQCIQQTALIPIIEKSGNPLKIEFLPNEIKTSSLQANGHYAAVGRIDHPSEVKEPITIHIPASTVPKIIQILTSLKNKPIEIFINEARSKIQIRSKVLGLTFYLEEANLPDVFSLKNSLENTPHKEAVVDVNEYKKTLELIELINGKNSITKISSQKDKIKLTTKEIEEVNREIEALTDDPFEGFATTEVLEKTLKVLLNSNEEISKIKIKYYEDKKTYQLQNIEEEYPSVLFAGAST